MHEFKALLNNTLGPERTAELRNKMLAAGPYSDEGTLDDKS